GGGPGLAAKPLHESTVTRQLRVQHLDGHIAGQHRVMRSVDLAHPAGGDAGDDLVAAFDSGFDHGHRTVPPMIWGGRPRPILGPVTPTAWKAARPGGAGGGAARRSPCTLPRPARTPPSGPARRPEAPRTRRRRPGRAGTSSRGPPPPGSAPRR